jgi:hypothetical protein
VARGGEQLRLEGVGNVEQPGSSQPPERLGLSRALPDRDRAERAFERLAPDILENTALEPDAQGYVHPPYAFSPTPDSLAARLYDDAAMAMARHLDALAAKQQEDGGWPIGWGALSPGVELEARSIVTLSALKTLRAYGRL